MKRKTDAPLKAIGITCGIGSLLIGARAAGFKVEGQLEWRKYYFAQDDQGRNTFIENFPNALFKNSIEELNHDEIQRLMGADLAVGHPECGNFSQLSGANKGRLEKLYDPADIPLFVDLVARLRPRYFVMDDLPRSFLAYPMSKYAEKLADYDLYPEWISNWGYGNVQKGRNRMFMLGALRAERWAFRPGESENTLTVADVVGDLARPSRRGNIPNHEPHDNTIDCFRALNLGEYRRKSTWAEVQEYFRDKPGGHTLEYVREDGSVVKRIGFLKGHWERTSHVLTGGNAILHHHRCEPYTIRERARIQGFPDDFAFYGTVLNDRGEWNHDLNQHMVRQTGKAMPVQFATYVARQVLAKIEKKEFTSSGRRVIPANEHVDEAKRWYCNEVGYADQQAACGECWLAQRCSIRVEKYGMPSMTRTTSRTQAAAPVPTAIPGAGRVGGGGKVRSQKRRSKELADRPPAGRALSPPPAPLGADNTKIEEF